MASQYHPSPAKVEDFLLPRGIPVYDDAEPVQQPTLVKELSPGILVRNMKDESWKSMLRAIRTHWEVAIDLEFGKKGEDLLGNHCCKTNNEFMIFFV